ncbi:hemerythrin domain-containing protein [Blastococcus xanthinilyticus]|uniref:Hemerythrin HHE cation binding domain-containing protein n=1 Tax=Blastococcus xanthinilyticus TaxID=1564164 RepID=A0A5S5D393_9ACTN|nr:hemerythrin domain-containing protein [Blastococcus xanthinilyticus]TYP90421.1 hemerythrin HHE cation binding domain-containing protein [Blastococcus xanthinilyticus]
MTAPPDMTMNRVIHGAVRRDLDRLSTALDRLPDGDRARAAQLQRAFAHLRTELTHDHEGEDAHLWPMLAGAGVDADLLAAMESEHHAMAEALADTDAALTRLAGTGVAADVAAARAGLERTREVVERHLVHEETELEPLLRPHLDSPEWKAVEKKLSRQPVSVTGPFFAWVTDGMTDEHRAYLRKTVPTPVVTVLARVFGRRYYREVAPTWRG